MVKKILLFYQTMNLIGIILLLIKTDISVYTIFGIWFFYSVLTFINGFWDGFNQGMRVCLDIFGASNTEELQKTKKNTEEFMRENWIYYFMVPFKSAGYWNKNKLSKKNS